MIPALRARGVSSALGAFAPLSLGSLGAAAPLSRRRVAATAITMTKRKPNAKIGRPCKGLDEPVSKSTVKRRKRAARMAQQAADSASPQRELDTVDVVVLISPEDRTSHTDALDERERQLDGRKLELDRRATALAERERELNERLGRTAKLEAELEAKLAGCLRLRHYERGSLADDEDSWSSDSTLGHDR